MWLKGSCHCQKISFQVFSQYPYPFNYCYCSICRKTAGSGGYAINLSADSSSMQVKGEKYLKIYRAKIDGKVSSGHRYFCSECGSALWLYDPSWPELVHPHAGAIDSELPTAPEHTHLLLDSKKEWVEVFKRKKDKSFSHYPSESIKEWHERLDLVLKPKRGPTPKFEGKKFSFPK